MCDIFEHYSQCPSSADEWQHLHCLLFPSFSSQIVSGLEDMGAPDMGYQLFEVLDTNGDGKVTAKEFVEGFEVRRAAVIHPWTYEVTYSAGRELSICF